MFATVCRKNLLKIAAAYAKAAKVPLKTVSSRAYGNPQFFDKLRSGEQSVSIKIVDQLLKWFRDNWPPNADWPFLPPLYMNRNQDRR